MKHVLYFTKRIHSFSGRILYLNLIGMVLVSLFEGVSILLLIPLINLTGLLDVNSKSTSAFSWLSTFFNNFPKTISLLIILVMYLLLILGQSFFQRKQTILNTKIQQSFIRHLREETYKLLLQANWSFFLNKRKSDIINLMTNEIILVSAGTNMFLQFLTSIVFTLIQLGIAFCLSPKMTICVMFFGIAIIFFSRKFINKSNLIGNETYELTEMYIAGITDHFNGIKDIKSNMLEEPHLTWFQDLSKRMELNRLKLVKLNTISELIYKIVSAVLIVIFMFFSIKMFQAQQAQLILIVIIFSRLWPRFSGIQSNLEQLGSVSPSFKALVDLQDQCNKTKEFNERDLHNVKPLLIEKGLECRNINFRYNTTENTYALQNINLNIPANRMTAIVGRSGAGKSTLIDLLMGLNQPETGEVLIDGESLTSQNLLALRRSISYVPQDPFLFNKTIRENLQIIDQYANEEQIWEALDFAAAADFVRKLPNGLDTLIGDRGIKLSGGERQRLVLARAILRKPSILVLDEATSALDTENESKIQEALERLKGTMTILVIAHRLSTIRNADQVIVLDHGEIIQQGQFSQLANEKKGMFSRLLRKQMGVSVRSMN
ncbi:ABC transporter ATP-binding protein [Neobacillus ginsengisoli]|uniref:ATP-binding cassette subfamily C protein n=1 Tax=Neobacillus ginsengisoli TaxID=904295 RepID=A0ABT9XU22_9BACI|nr:ABC transporter ATP-binding protein [Neobacillus ginsengisoli]MDQ0198795.1 ATP-binding cassette subfamily C protein [Neobacillus ginsengisoli]